MLNFVCTGTLQSEPVVLFVSPNEELSIVSPRYPHNYPNGVEVVWIIKTDMDWEILISFSDFSTKDSDNFRAGNGDDYPNNVTISRSGRGSPNDLLSTGNIMWLSFTSSPYISDGTDRGFALTASSLNVPVTGISA